MNAQQGPRQIDRDAIWQACRRYPWMTEEAWECLQPEYEDMRQWLVGSCGDPGHGRLLLHAIHHRLVPLVAALLAAGASACVQNYSSTERETFMPLSYAVSASSCPYRPELVDLLLAHGADPMEQVSDHLVTKSVVAAAIDDPQALADVLDRGWDPDMRPVLPPGSSNLHDETPLQKAAMGFFDKHTPRWARRRSVRLLLKAGANLEARNQFGQPPLILATLHHPMLVPVLLEHGAAIESVDRQGRGLLDAFSQIREYGNANLAQAMFRRFAQVECQTLEKATAIPSSGPRHQPRL